MNVCLKKPNKITLHYDTMLLELEPQKDFQHLFFTVNDELGNILAEKGLLVGGEPKEKP